MKREASFRTEVWICFGLWVIGVLGNWWIDAPNVNPLAAIALFGGVVFRKTWMAIACPFILVLSAGMPSSMSLPLWLTVSAGLLVGVPLGRYLRQKLLMDVQSNRWATPALRIGLASIGGSLIFYWISNTAWWLTAGFYPPTFSGWFDCLAAGIPFLANTLLGDLCFCGTLFAVAAVVVSHPMRSAIWIAFKAAPLRS